MSKIVTIAGAAALLGAVTAGGYVATSFLGGGGPQPEDVLPADTIAYAKIDMNPSPGQKLNVFKISKKFDEISLDSEDDIKGGLLEALAEGSGGEIDYARDIEPWVGDRLAIAAIPDAESGVAPLLVVQFTDEDAMSEALDRVKEIDGFGYAVRDDFVLIGEDQAAMTAAAEATEVLADSSSHNADVKRLDGDQIITAWADLGANFENMPQAYLSDAELETVSEVSGRVVMGVSAQSDHVELTSKSIGVEAEGLDAADATGRTGTDIISGFPEETMAALSVAGIDETAIEMWKQWSAAFGLTEEAERLGLEMPEDLSAVVGTEIAVGMAVDAEDVQGMPDIFGQVTTPDPERAVEVWDLVFGDSVLTKTGGGFYAAGSTPEALSYVLSMNGGLGETEAFQRVVADPSAAMVAFVDLAGFIDVVTDDDGEFPEAMDALDAFGISVDGEGEEPTLTARLSFR